MSRKGARGHRGHERTGKPPRGFVSTPIPNVFRRSRRDGRDLLFTRRKASYRNWDPNRSKLAAYILKGMPHIPFEISSDILYLGAASGNTASHIADICSEGMVYCVEFSKRSFRDLIGSCEEAENMAPILGDARSPQNYAPLVSQVDVVYQDIAQRDQTGIFLKNLESLVRPNGEKGNGILMVKSRSIDVTRRPEEVYGQVIAALEKRVTVLDSRVLSPYERDHMAVTVSY